MTQLGFFGESVAGQRLGPRQELVLRELRGRGLTDDEAGAIVHGSRGKHSPDERCGWCAREGRDVLVSLRRHGLAIRRRTGQWEAKGLRRPESPPVGSTYNQLPEGF